MIEDAMKKKEFVELLNDYMDEISDPKNKEVPSSISTIIYQRNMNNT